MYACSHLGHPACPMHDPCPPKNWHTPTNKLTSIRQGRQDTPRLNGQCRYFSAGGNQHHQEPTRIAFDLLASALNVYHIWPPCSEPPLPPTQAKVHTQTCHTHKTGWSSVCRQAGCIRIVPFSTSTNSFSPSMSSFLSDCKTLPMDPFPGRCCASVVSIFYGFWD